MINLDKPAMPQLHTIDGNWLPEPLDRHKGLTAREHACIQLSVPRSGDAELDALIREAERRDLAGKAMQAAYMLHMDGTRNVGKDAAALGQEAYSVADALLAALETAP